jgi:hypothetical protein
MKRWPVPKEIISEKRAYTLFVGIIRFHMLRALGKSSAELNLPTEEVMAIPDVDVDKFIFTLLSREAGVLGKIEAKNGEYYPYIKDDSFIHVSCVKNSREILEYMKTLPVYELTYDVEEDGVLNFWGAQITIAKSRNSNEHHLLALLFTDKEKEWGCDEIWEHTLGNGVDDYNKRKWRKLVAPAYVIAKKVLSATNDGNFLIVTDESVRINPRYVT